MNKLDMQFPLYYVSTFTNDIFCGNPAAVCLLQDWLSDNELNAIAKQNNLPVTVFIVPDNDSFNIRWITSEYELDICGHGSLAAAFVVFNYLKPTLKKIKFQSRSESLEVFRIGDLINLNFPAKDIQSCAIPLLSEGLGLLPKEIYQYKNERCLAIFDTEEEIKQLKPNFEILKNIKHRGIIVTAPGNEIDFVSRTFYPYKMLSEDAVTGTSHCLLIPYWANKLNKIELHARQLSQRGGELLCEYQGKRVLIGGKAVLYMQGSIYMNR